MTVVRKSQVEGTFKLGLTDTGRVNSEANGIEKFADTNVAGSDATELPVPQDVVSKMDSLVWQQAYDEGFQRGKSEAEDRLNADYTARCNVLTEQTGELVATKAKYNKDLTDLSLTLAALGQQIRSYEATLAQRSIDIAACALRDLLLQNVVTHENLIKVVSDVVATQSTMSGQQLFGGEKIQPLLARQLQWNITKDHSLADFEVEIRQTPSFNSIDIERYFDELKAALITLAAGVPNE